MKKVYETKIKPSDIFSDGLNKFRILIAVPFGCIVAALATTAIVFLSSALDISHISLPVWAAWTIWSIFLLVTIFLTVGGIIAIKHKRYFGLAIIFLAIAKCAYSTYIFANNSFQFLLIGFDIALLCFLEIQYLCSIFAFGMFCFENYRVGLIFIALPFLLIPLVLYTLFLSAW